MSAVINGVLTYNGGGYIFREYFDPKFLSLAAPHEHGGGGAVCHLTRVTAGGCSVTPLRECRADLSKSL